MTNDKKLLTDMVKFLEQKIELLIEIYNITLSNQDYIIKNDIPSLNEHILLRQEKIDLIDNIDRDFIELFNQFKSASNVSSLDELIHPEKELVKNLQVNIERIKEIIEKLLKLIH